VCTADHVLRDAAHEFSSSAECQFEHSHRLASAPPPVASLRPNEVRKWRGQLSLGDSANRENYVSKEVICAPCAAAWYLSIWSVLPF